VSKTPPNQIHTHPECCCLLDDVSSISGSDSEVEDTLDTYATAQGKIFLQNDEGKVFSMYACLLYDKKVSDKDT
jgi:hypothetical protein